MEEMYVASFKDLLDDMLVCRTIGHSWDDNPGAEIATMWSWAISLRCTRCHTERFDALNNLGEVISRYYRYTPGYQISKDRRGYKVTKQELRTELMRRRVLARRRGKKHLRAV